MPRLGTHSPLLQAALRRPTAQLLPRCAPPSTTASAAPKTTTMTVTPPTATHPAAARTFSHLPNLRPTLSAPRPVFRASTSASGTLPQSPFTPSLLPSSSFPPATTTAAAAAAAADVVPRQAVTAHPGLALAQARWGPRPTMARATRLVQKRRHGFLSRKRTQSGRKTLARRRAKGRRRLAH